MIGFTEDPQWLFGSDWFKILNTLVLGFGNGFLGTILMVMGPYKVSSADSERAGQIMAFHMSLGRGLGSLIGLIGFYQVFKDIQDALKLTNLLRDKFV
jgi:ABC-type bacteriocin/lantibiotic exporter with double-glycine peptidase domain